MPECRRPTASFLRVTVIRGRATWPWDRHSVERYDEKQRFWSIHFVNFADLPPDVLEFVRAPLPQDASTKSALQLKRHENAKQKAANKARLQERATSPKVKVRGRHLKCSALQPFLRHFADCQLPVPSPATNCEFENAPTCCPGRFGPLHLSSKALQSTS